MKRRRGPLDMSEMLSFRLLTHAIHSDRPWIAVILGSGLGAISDRLTQARSTAFGNVPGLSVPTIPGHVGKVTLAQWAGHPVLLFEGRLHYYEGQPWRSVLRPIHLAARLGVRILVLTNAAGGIHEDLRPGQLMVVRDHIDWTRP